MTRKTNQKGFTLIELLITVAIVAILATIALPAYSIYKDRARFAEVIHATETAKTAVDVCIHTRGPANCVTGAGGTLAVPNGADAAAYVAAGGVTFASGPAGGPYVIQSTAAADGATDASGTVTVDWNDNAVGGLTFRLVGTVNSATNSVVWEENPTGNVGTCVAAGLC